MMGNKIYRIIPIPITQGLPGLRLLFLFCLLLFWFGFRVFVQRSYIPSLQRPHESEDSDYNSREPSGHHIAPAQSTIA